MTNQLNDLKSKHIADEVKKVDDKVKKNITDIVTTKNSLLHNKSILDDLEREASFNRRLYYYSQQSYFFFEPNHSLEMEELFIHGYQKEFMTKKKE